MTRKKIMQTIVLLSMLVIFPMISWFYLSSGFNYRKDLLEELEPITAIPDFTFSQSDGVHSAYDHLGGNVVLMANCENNSFELNEFIRVADQFDGRKDFYAFLLDSFNIELESPISHFYELPADMVWRNNLEQKSGYKISGGTAFLIDTALQVRRFYSLSNPDEVTRLVEHVTVLLPLEGKKRMRK